MKNEIERLNHEVRIVRKYLDRAYKDIKRLKASNDEQYELLQTMRGKYEKVKREYEMLESDYNNEY